MNKTSQFHIEKPTFQKNLVITTLIKYLVLAIATFIATLVLVGFLLRKFRLDLSFEVFVIISLILTVFVYLRHFLRKFKLSDIYHICLDYEKKEIRFNSLGKIKGKEINKTIKFSDLNIDYAIRNSSLLGDQRIFTFFENGKLYNELNLDTSAWVRLENLDKMIEEIAELENINIEEINSRSENEVSYRQ